MADYDEGTPFNGIWYSEVFPDTYIEAEDEEEAIEFAKDYLKECIISNHNHRSEITIDEDIERLETDYVYRAKEIEEISEIENISNLLII